RPTCWREWVERVSPPRGLLVVGVITTLIGGGSGEVPPRVSIRAVAISADDKLLAAAGEDGRVQLWDVGSHQPLGRALKGGDAASVISVAFSSDAKLLASVGSDSKVQVWDLASQQLLAPALTSVSTVSRSVPVASIANELGIMIPAGPVPTVGLVRAASVTSVFFSPDNKLLAGAGREGTVQVWDVASHQRLGQPLTTPGTASIASVFFSSDDKLLASVGSDSKVQVWDVVSHQPLGEPFTAAGT